MLAICASIIFNFQFSTFNSVQAQDSSRIELCVETRQFFQDNEFFGLHAVGYTLPGFYLRPHLEWSAKSGAWRVEAGVHWLHFWGARNYPSGQSMNVWPIESDTTSAVHVLPWVRAEMGAPDGKWRVTMGNLRAHKLPLPLYNPERLYAADPEAGVQMQLDYKHFDMDVWVDWREYIWQRSSRQERFTAGLSGEWRVGSEEWEVKLPVHIIGQHVGGQGLKEHQAVQNRFNGAVGLLGEWRVESGEWRVEAGCYAMGFTQKNMPVVLYRRGWGIYPVISGEWRVKSGELFIDGGYWQGHGFVPLLGSVLFSNVGFVDGITYFGMNRMFNIGARYSWQALEVGSISVEGRWYHYLERDHPSQYTVGVFIDINPRVTLWSK